MNIAIDTNIQNVDNDKDKAASPAEVPKRIKRRRGACTRCRARKVRCDGKISCNECQRLGFDCRYPLTYQKRAALTPISLHQPPTPNENSSVQGSAEDGFLQTLASGSFEDIFLSDLPPYPQNDTVTSSAADYSTNLTTLSPDDNDTLVLSAHSDFYPDLNLDTQAAFNEHCNFNHIIQSSVDSVLFSPADHISKASNSLKHTTKLGTELRLPIDIRENNSTARHLTTLESIYADKVQQNDLIKEALLEDIQEYCNRWRGQQSNDLSYAFKRLISEPINIYPSNIYGSVSENDEILLVHRVFALDCIDACLKDTHGVATFLDRASLEPAMQEILNQSPSSPPKRALAHIVLAIGTHILGSESRESSRELPKSCAYDPLVQFSAAIKLKSQILEQSFSVLVAMAYFATLIGSSEASGLLSNCIHYAQVMRLGRSSSINRLCETTVECEQTRRAFWFLYSIEKTFCLRAEIFPVLDEDFVDYRPPKNEGSPVQFDWLSISCHYASLCSSILKEFYSQRSLKNQHLRSISDLEELLHNWVQSLPPEFQSVESQPLDFNLMSSQGRRKKLHIYFQYHEALLTIHTRRRSQHSSFMPEFDPWLSDSDEKRASSLRKILAVSCQLTASDVRSDPSLYRLMCIATCSLAVATIRDPGDRRDLSYLATAAGFFGQMALGDIEGPLEEITEIVRIAQQSIKERQHGQNR